jgi:hypothetical protein
MFKHPGHGSMMDTPPMGSDNAGTSGSKGPDNRNVSDPKAPLMRPHANNLKAK